MSRMCLNVLNLSSNRITCLPAELYSMSSLHALDVDANPLTAPPPNVTKLFCSISFYVLVVRLSIRLFIPSRHGMVYR